MVWSSVTFYASDDAALFPVDQLAGEAVSHVQDCLRRRWPDAGPSDSTFWAARDDSTFHVVVRFVEWNETASEPGESSFRMRRLTVEVAGPVDDLAGLVGEVWLAETEPVPSWIDGI